MKFFPVYRYKYNDGKETRIKDKNRINVKSDDGKINIDFYTDNGKPTLPLKFTGDLYHKGWDIPTTWAIDSDGQVWANDAHGSSLEKSSPKDLLSLAEDHEDKVHLSKALGLNPPQPSWYREALAEGWTPPKGLKVNGIE